MAEKPKDEAKIPTSATGQALLDVWLLAGRKLRDVNAELARIDDERKRKTQILAEKQAEYDQAERAFKEWMAR